MHSGRANDCNHLPYAAEAVDTHAGWVELVERIRSQKTDGMEELYQLFSRGIRFYLCRQLGPQELDDKVHDTFVVVVQAIRRGEQTGHALVAILAQLNLGQRVGVVGVEAG